MHTTTTARTPAAHPQPAPWGMLAAQATGSPARSVVCKGDDAHLLHDDGTLEPAPMRAAA